MASDDRFHPVTSPLKPAAFLDRDGTLIEERHFLADPDDLVLLPGAPAALKRLRDRGFALVIITNQSGIARGYFSEDTLSAIHIRLASLLADHGVHLDGIFYCPHHPEGSVERYSISCRCRKPSPGLIEQALKTLDIRTEGSVAIGDSPRDLECTHPWEMKRILVTTGHGSKAKKETIDKARPHFVAQEIGAAVDWFFGEGVSS